MTVFQLTIDQETVQEISGLSSIFGENTNSNLIVQCISLALCIQKYADKNEKTLKIIDCNNNPVIINLRGKEKC